MKEAINQFENEVQNSFIRPKNIPDDRKIESFSNFFNKIPNLDKNNEQEVIYLVSSE